MDDRGVMRIPLFPLRSVLCPGVALPLHVFEQRYRLMVDRCLADGEPFGVVLLREGPEVGPPKGRIADVGTTAAIRQAGRYPDGRLDILTVGQQRFRLESVDNVSEPYLIGRVRLLSEPTGAEREARRQAERVGRRFLEYLELLQPEGEEDGPEIEIEFELEVEAGDTSDTEDPDEVGQGPDEGRRVGDETPEPLVRADGSLPLDGADPLIAQMDAADLSPAQRRELLMAAARRLTATDDPTALSYVLTALIQVDLGSRQRLLEAPDTVERLRGLDRLLAREGWFLRQGLRPIIIDTGRVGPRGLGRTVEG
jgi:Lon protease-like protein